MSGFLAWFIPRENLSSPWRTEFDGSDIFYSEMKQKSEKPYTAKQITSALIALIFLLGVLCLYYGSSFAPALSRSDGEHDGSDPVLGGDIRDFDDLFEDQEHNPEVPKSIPVRFPY